MPTSEQGDLFPFASPETALALCRQLERRILAIAPELSIPQTMAVIGELSLASLMLDHITRDVENTPAYRERQLATPIIPIERAEQILPAWRRIARRRRTTVASWRA